MRIQRLDIQGFKSFAERISLHFGHGVTGVVGPNGCGKSNIVDAIRWAMGEQSPRMLRGGSMQDVIFNGSEARGPMGMAEVTLSFENDGKNVPPDYAHISEIQVTRRLYRDGDSEYEINKTPCRLKDVHDLFLGTGVGTRAYSIIQQGQVSEIMRVKPEDRRRIIEEAAGITKYKARKEAALRKMDATRQNLTRIDDVTKELGRRLGSLKRQAKKAERYVELKAQVKDIDFHLVTLKFFELKNGVQYDRAVFDHLVASVAGDVARAAALDTQVGVVREALSADEKKLNEKQGRLYEIDAHLALHEQTAELSKREYERSKKRDEEAAVEVDQLREQRAMLLGAREELSRGKSALEEETAVDESSLQGAFEDLNSHRQQRQSLGHTVEGARKSMIEHSTTAAKAASDVHNLRSSLTDMGSRRDAVTHERAPLVDELIRLQEAVTLLDAERSTVETDKTTAEAERKAAGEQIQERKRELSKFERTAADAQDSWQKKRSRLASLEEIHARYEQAPEAVRALLKRGGVLEGKAKLLADLFEADAATETALEAAIGARLQSVVVDDEALALRASEALRDGRTKGRADILITAALPAALADRIDGLRCAADLVQFGKQADPARSVLSRIFLATTAEQALSCWARARALGATIVCDSGEVFAADGAMRAGVADKDGQGVLRQKREMRELVDAVGEAEQAAQQAQTALQSQRQSLLELDEALARVTERAQALSLKTVEVRAGHKRVSDELQRLRERQQRLQQDEERLTTSLTKATTDLAAREQALVEAERLRTEIEGSLQQQSIDLAALDAVIATKQESVTTMKVRAASAAERREGLTKNLEQAIRQSDEVDNRIGRLQRQIEEGHAEREKLTLQEAESRAQLAVLTDERKATRSMLDDARRAFEQQSESARVLEHELKAARQALDGARGKQAAVQVRIREQELELDALVDRTIERHRVTPQEVLFDYHHLALPSSDAVVDMHKQLGELERQIDGLGAINMTAIAESAELQKRNDFLRGQADDLTHALSQLEKAIVKINRTTKKRFQETFDGINERFTQVFPRLFRGGKAWLALTDPNDLLATGVEIYAQPPGKKLGSVGLMSGGEQALTAVSLLFSIFLLKPSPFCLLDEVDAPLDEANVGRFNEMVRDVSQISQFIVITHNKKTMEVADQLYGITMEEPGISKTVNVRMQA